MPIFETNPKFFGGGSQPQTQPAPYGYVSFGGAQDRQTAPRSLRDYVLKARSDILFKGDWTEANRLLPTLAPEDRDAFSPEALREEVETINRIRESNRSGSGTLLDQLMGGIADITPLLATAALAYMGGTALMGGAGAGTSAAGAGAAGGGAAAGGTTAAGTAAGTTAGTAAGLTAAGGAAGGTGLTAGAGGVTGLTAGTTTGAIGGGALGGGIGTGAGSAATAANLAGALAPGFFAGETAGTGLAAGAGTAGTTGATTGTGTAAERSTALSRILSGNGRTEDYLTLAGQIAPSLLGAYASDKQTDALSGLAAEYRAMGAPYRGRLAELYADPNAFLTSPEVTVPVQQGTDALARALSTRGNPAGSGTALSEIQNYASNQLFGRLDEEKRTLGSLGGLASFNAAAPGAATDAIGSEANFYNALGYGAGQVLNPPKMSLAELLKRYNIEQGLA